MSVIFVLRRAFFGCR